MGGQISVTRARARSLGWASPATATVLGALLLVILAAVLTLSGLADQLTLNQILVGCTAVSAFGGVGVVVARRQPHNPIGWILIGLVILLGLRVVGEFYAVLYYRLGHTRLPFAPAAVVLTNTVWLPAFALPPLAIVLFPDGRLASRRWRWGLWAYAGLIAVATLVVAAQPTAAVLEHDIHLDSSGTLTNTGDLTGWLACGAAVTVVWLIAMLGLDLPIVGAAAMPASIAIAILKYRLYDIDRIISRTVAYTILTGLLLGVYAGLVLLTTKVLTIKSPVAVAGSTLVAAALFTPLRSRVQRAVDRRFNRARYDADETVATLAARLKDAMDLDAVQADLANVVQQALEPAHVSVWMNTIWMKPD